MSKKHPTPWKFDIDDADEPIKDANGERVFTTDDGFLGPDDDTIREIVVAVNERDRIRDLVKRLSRHLANYITSESENDLLREARAALGEDAP